MEVNMREMKYGKKEVVTSLDNNGSFQKRTEHVVEGKVSYPLEDYYEIRERVSSPIEEAVAIAKIINELKNNPNLSEAGYRIEGYRNKDKKGHYHVVRCFRSLVFDKQ